MSNDPRHSNLGVAEGGLAAMVHEPAVPTWRERFPPETCGKILVLAGLLVWLNFWHLRIMVATWQYPNWSHGYLIPLFSLYFLYTRREEFLGAPRRVSLLGVPLILLGIFQVLVGLYPIQNTWVSHLGLIPMVFGLVLYLAGPATLRVTWLPIAFLVFAMPIPSTLYSRIALPLQNLSAAASSFILRVSGVEIEVSQSALMLTSLTGREHSVTVAEACSGMRLLMAFLALGVAMAYLDDRPIWQRLTLVLMGVPIAVVCNILRVVITATMYVWDQPELGQDFMHHFTGMLMLAPALLMLWGLSWLLEALFVEEDEEDQESDRPDRSPPEPIAVEGGKP